MAHLQDPAATKLERMTTRKKDMKRKSSSTLLLTNATEEDALRLAVSAADGAAVLAAVSDTCVPADHHLYMARTAVEAALHLSRARRRLGLHEFCFHVTLTSPAAAAPAEEDWAQGLDDAAMQEAFADVGLVAAAGEERERSRLGGPEEAGEEEEGAQGGACHADVARSQAGLLDHHGAAAGVASTQEERWCPAEARQHGQQQQQEEPKHRSCFRAYERPPKTGLLEYSNLTESGDTVGGWAAARPGVVLPQDRLCLALGKEAGLGGVGNRQPRDCSSQKKLHGKPPCQNPVSSSGSCPLKRPRVVCSSVVPCTPATASSCAAPKPCGPTGSITRKDAATALDHSCPGEDHQSLGQDGVDNVPPSDPSGGVLGGKASDDHPSLQMVSNSTASQSLGLLLRAVDIMASRKAPFATRFGNDLPDEAPFVQAVDNPFLPDSENASESPPLVWPRCKKSRLWAFRVDDSESTQDVADKSPNNNISSPGDSYALVWPRSTKSRMRTCGVIDSQSTQGLTAQGPVTDMSLLVVSRTTDKRESPSHLHPCSKKPRLEGGTEVQPLSRQPQAGTKEEEEEKEKDVSVLKNRSWINGEAGGHVDCLERHLTTVACEEVAVGAKTPVLPHPKLAPAALQTYCRRNKWQRTGNHCISRKKQPAVVGQPRQLFKGLRFLLTGFRRTREDDITSRIKQHGGSVLSEVPPPSVLEAKLLRETAGARMKLPIVVASNQVRTAKFLYACAIGCPPLKADWISSSISKNRCLPTISYELIPCVQSPKGLDGDGGPSLIFQGLRVLLHGQSSFRSRFSALVEHGGGRVLRSIRSLKQGPGAVSRKLVLVVAENCEGFHATHKRAALRFNLSVVPAEWLVQSLLLQRLLPLPFEDVSVKQKPAALLSPKLDPLSNVFVVRKKRSTLVRNKSSMSTAAQATLEHQPPRQLCKELCISSSPIPAAQLSMMGVALSSEECTNHATSENKLVLEPCQ